MLAELSRRLKTSTLDEIIAESPQLRALAECLRLPDVLAHHNKSVRVLHTLSPLGVAMAGEDGMTRTRIEGKRRFSRDEFRPGCSAME